jgi:hypothetical protein
MPRYSTTLRPSMLFVVDTIIVVVMIKVTVSTE